MTQRQFARPPPGIIIFRAVCEQSEPVWRKTPKATKYFPIVNFGTTYGSNCEHKVHEGTDKSALSRERVFFLHIQISILPWQYITAENFSLLFSLPVLFLTAVSRLWHFDWDTIFKGLCSFSLSFFLFLCPFSFFYSFFDSFSSSFSSILSLPFFLFFFIILSYREREILRFPKPAAKGRFLTFPMLSFLFLRLHSSFLLIKNECAGLGICLGVENAVVQGVKPMYIYLSLS